MSKKIKTKRTKKKSKYQKKFIPPNMEFDEMLKATFTKPKKKSR